ncbi:MAG: mitochondrial fission ELM1 family protein [Candidatus Puniceispirillales bacterium]
MMTNNIFPNIWVISDGTMGMEVQSLGLAEALTENPHLIRVTLPRLARMFPRLAKSGLLPLPRALRQALAEYGQPDLVITTGRRHAGLSLMMRRFGRGKIKTIHIQNPRLPAAWFDWLIVPSHDKIRGENILVTLGSLNRMATLMSQKFEMPDEVKSIQGRKIVVMIGGSNIRYQVHEQDYYRFGQLLANVAAMTQSALILVPSRRALANAAEVMKGPLAETRHWWWDGTSPNPYPCILNAGDAIIVTADSVNMTSEAAAMGKSVHVAELRPESGRVALFHKVMEEAGYTKPIDRISLYHFFMHNDNRLDETTRIANLLKPQITTSSNDIPQKA